MMKAVQGDLVEMTLCRVAIGNKSKGIGWKRGVAMFHRSAASTIQESKPIRAFSEWTRVSVYVVMNRLPVKLFPLSIKCCSRICMSVMHQLFMAQWHFSEPLYPEGLHNERGVPPVRSHVAEDGCLSSNDRCSE